MKLNPVTLIAANKTVGTIGRFNNFCDIAESVDYGKEVVPTAASDVSRFRVKKNCKSEDANVGRIHDGGRDDCVTFPFSMVKISALAPNVSRKLSFEVVTKVCVLSLKNFSS